MREEFPRSERFEGMSDEEIVQLAQQEQDGEAMDYIVNKYRNFVKSKARAYFLVGADRDDIIQEGMIGLYKATSDFRGDKLASFRAFAELCVTRQIITAIKTATRQKHIPLNSYVSLNKPIYEDESDRTLQDILSGIRVSDPREAELPDVGIVEMKDAETGRKAWVDTSSARVREHYARVWQERSAAILSALKHHRIDTAEVSTDGDYVVELIKLFKQR